MHITPLAVWQMLFFLSDFRRNQFNKFFFCHALCFLAVPPADGNRIFFLFPIAYHQHIGNFGKLRFPDFEARFFLPYSPRHSVRPALSKLLTPIAPHSRCCGR